MAATLPIANHFYRDHELGRDGVKLLANEYFVTREDMVVQTVLGSCVAACIRDAGAGIGGMNHFLLPDSGDPTLANSDAMRYGAFAMEMLINALLKGGARRNRLEAKVFGGGAVLRRMRTINVGEENARFVRKYLALEQIPIVAEDLLGEHPRKVAYLPATGQVLVRKLPLEQRETLEEVRAREAAMADALRTASREPVGRVEMFARPAARPRPQVELFATPRPPRAPTA
ncbi:chemoreceptor glutamine deamidase CheD [Chitinasiproducens palmae]|uniref:Probable chemoreceptor glutamine deamidase CheD n=1 Tax=Chitinasiproducens palmae TaxID=1770053 RepID=A0A1H2PK22_9BURK|nr:chemoreceptor glutamine deamidase CheD [Chitinasiproducens palmae]SDV46636.1 CheD, stimulates methylation of MCP proteins [Chitinasiproducens palmae]